MAPNTFTVSHIANSHRERVAACNADNRFQRRAQNRLRGRDDTGQHRGAFVESRHGRARARRDALL